MEWEEIERRLSYAFLVLGSRDREFFIRNPLERPAVVRLSMYLQVLFPVHHVDCEYGRYEKHSKSFDHGRLSSVALRALEEQNLWNDYQAWTEKIYDEVVFGLSNNPTKVMVPDIVIHKRQSQSDNLLCIEAKPNGGSWDTFDSVKLCLLTAGITVKGRKLKYDNGLQLNLRLNSTKRAPAVGRLWKDGYAKPHVTYPYQ